MFRAHALDDVVPFVDCGVTVSLSLSVIWLSTLHFAGACRNGHKVGSVGKGSRVEMVDPRLKKDKRAKDSAASGKRGRSKSAPKTKKRYKSRR